MGTTRRLPPAIARSSAGGSARPLLATLLALAACGRHATSPPAPAPSAPPPSPRAAVAATAGATPAASPRPAPQASPARAAAWCSAKSFAVVDDTSMGFHVTDLTRVAVSEVPGRATVTFAVNGDRGCPYDGCYVLRDLHAVDVATGSAGAPSPDEALTPYALPSSSLGISPTADAVPFAIDGALYVLTQGHAGAAPMPAPGEPEADTMYVVQDGRIVRRSEAWFSADGLAAASFGAGALAVGTGAESGWQRSGTRGPSSVRVFRLASDRPPTGELVVAGAGTDGLPSTSFDAPAIAVVGERAAVAFRSQPVDARGGPRRLFVGWVDTRSGKPLGPPVLLAAGDVGAPALVGAGGVLHAVWAERERAAPYRLRHARWVGGEGAPEAPTPLTTPTDTAMAPSLTTLAGRPAIAWMDGDTGRHGGIYAGVGATLEEAAASGQKQSADDVHNARDPKWGSGGERALLVWSEHDGPRGIRVVSCGARGAR